MFKAAVRTSASLLHPLHVVVVMPLASPWSRLIAQRLASLGVLVQIVDFESQGRDPGYLDRNSQLLSEDCVALEAQVAGVHRIVTPRWDPARLASSAASLRRIARKTNADLVLALYGGRNALIAFLSGIRPYFVYVVGSDVLLSDGLKRHVAKVTLSAAESVIANGNYLAAKTTELSPNASVTCLYLGTDLERFSFKPARGPTFVCTRGFLPVYDNATIIRALSSFPVVPDDLRVFFLSSGPLLSETVHLANTIIPSQWRDRISFAGGISDAGMAAHLQTSSYYLSASLSDGTSSSLLEAMACGVFPILSDIPANREWIVHETNGLLFTPGDPSSLAASIGRAIAGEEWMTNARAINRRLVEDRANVDASMGSLVELLESHVARKHSDELFPHASQCLL